MKEKKPDNLEKVKEIHDNDTELINRQLRNHVMTLQEKNATLKSTLSRTKEEIDAIKEEVKKLKSPPLPYGTFVRKSESPDLIVISVEGRLMEVNVASADIDVDKLEAGQFLLLNPGYNAIELRSPQEVGEIGKIVDIIENNRIIIRSHESDEVVINIAESLADKKLRVGDNIRYDRASLMAFEIMPKSEVEDVVLEEIPDVTYDDIGGLEDQLEQIKDAIELPYIYGYLYQQYSLKPPKGILLYGPPGCGKTLVAKAVANSLSARIHATLRNVRDALEVLITLSQKNAVYKDVAEKFEALRYEIYEYQSIYRYTQEDDVESLYDKLDNSSVLGNFIRRTEGDRSSPRLVCNIDDWHDLLIELKELGYGDLADKKRIGEMLEKKRKNYFVQREKVSDEEYAANWLRDFLTNNGIDLKGSLEKELKKTEEKLGGGVESYFLNIKGPELLNKYVGETEHKIREVFMKAREKAQRGLPVIVFFDEMESIFRTRGSGISSDVESTIVPQFLAEIDGVEKLDNVITIGASNRQDLIDPAVLRPGRLDVKIRIDRPDKDAARDIFSKYLTDDVPLAKDDFDENKMSKREMLVELIDTAVEDMYSEKSENRFLKVTYRNREQEILYFKDFSSGAMIEGIVSRAKTYAIKRTILAGGRGLRQDDLIEAIRDEYKENEDLPNTTNPDDWAKISGKKGEKIVSIETMLPKKQKDPKQAPEEVTVSNRYL